MSLLTRIFLPHHFKPTEMEKAKRAAKKKKNRFSSYYTLGIKLPSTEDNYSGRKIETEAKETKKAAKNTAKAEVNQLKALLSHTQGQRILEKLESNDSLSPQLIKYATSVAYPNLSSRNARALNPKIRNQIAEKLSKKELTLDQVKNLLTSSRQALGYEKAKSQKNLVHDGFTPDKLANNILKNTSSSEGIKTYVHNFLERANNLRNSFV
ncbi:MAG: hypothetical protein AAGI66_00520 [Cyanobacteria bacterium P01_H01_bin.74]